MNRLLLLLLFVLPQTSCNGIKKAVTVADEELLVRRLAPGVYQHISFLETQDFGTVACNGMVYAKGGEAIVFDTPATAEGAEALLAWIKTDLNSKVTAVVINHFHVDCLGSLNIFHQAGISSYANAMTIELASASEEEAIPQNKLVGDMMVGGHPVINRYFGGGHTKDNIASYLPEERILFGGCMVKSIGAGKGNLADADVAAWPETVSSIKSTYPNIKWVIPGHGNPGGPELLDYTVEMFRKK